MEGVGGGGRTGKFVKRDVAVVVVVGQIAGEGEGFVQVVVVGEEEGKKVDW